MKTTDMFSSENERKKGDENTPIFLYIRKEPLGLVSSPHVISLRAGKVFKKSDKKLQENIIDHGYKNVRESIIEKDKSLENLEYSDNLSNDEQEDDAVLSSIENLFRGKNARVEFGGELKKKNEKESIEKNETQFLSQTEQFQ
jgi:hypothetical protein